VSYHVELMPQAFKSLEALDKITAQRVVKKLRWLADNFDDLPPEPLVHDLKGLFKLRVWD